jgi:hypothetical protein
MFKVLPEILHTEEVVVVSRTIKLDEDVAPIEKGESPKLFVNEESEKLIVCRVLPIVKDAVTSVAA